MWQNLFLGAGVLIAIVLAWFLVYYWLNPILRKPDGKARVTGECGDTMELCLEFKSNKVAATSHWTNGCVYSLNCICAAADLAKGKTPDELMNIDAHAIQHSIGGLPKDHMHCATLAVATLQEAVGEYVRKTIGN
jgi:nitrogen fixation NifU-like protein